MLKRFIMIAEISRQRNNYNAVMQILAGINMHSVSRLKEVWEVIKRGNFVEISCRVCLISMCNWRKVLMI